MSLLRNTNGFEQLPDSKLLEKANLVHTGLSDNPNFPTPAPSLTEFINAINDFNDAVQAAGNGDRLQIAIKREKRDALVNIMHLLGYYVLYASAGSRTKALSSNFSFAKDPTPRVITKPVNLKVDTTTQAGQLTISIKKVPGAVAYLHQYCADPLLKEESWKTITSSTTKCMIEGLTPGTTYFVRVGAIGTKDQVMYSDVASKMAA